MWHSGQEMVRSGERGYFTFPWGLFLIWAKGFSENICHRVIWNILSKDQSHGKFSEGFKSFGINPLTCSLVAVLNSKEIKAVYATWHSYASGFLKGLLSDGSWFLSIYLIDTNRSKQGPFVSHAKVCLHLFLSQLCLMLELLKWKHEPRLVLHHTL